MSPSAPQAFLPSRARATAIAVVLACLGSVSTFGQEQTLRVIDPLDAAIPGAEVTLVCEGGGRPFRTTTSPVGIVWLPVRQDCELTVRAAGFAPWRGALTEAWTRGSVRLSIAPLEERVDVVGLTEPMLWAPLTSARLTPQDLALVGWDSALALRYAKARAGATLGADQVYVDGLPAAGLPPPTAIAELAVNPDPFSVLYSESDRNVIEIVSAVPDRTFRWSGGLLPRTLGARNPLAPEMSSERRDGHVSASGPVPWTPMTFAVDVNRVASREERPVFVSPGGPPERGLAEASAHSVAVVLVGHWHERLKTRLSVLSTRGTDSAVDVGGFVQPDAATGSRLASDELRLFVDAAGEQLRYRSGLLYGTSDTEFRARSEGLGLVVLDTVTAGGAPLAEMRLARRNWLWNNTLTPADASWTVGWSVASERVDEQLAPNPSGQVTFGSLEEYGAAMQGGAGGVWMRMTGTVRQALRLTTSAAFAEKAWRLPGAALRAGLRLDYQSGDGLAASPRLSGQVTLRDFTLQSGVGLFRQNWSNDVLMQARRFESTSAEWLVSDVPLPDRAGDTEVERVRTVIAGNFHRPLSLVARHGMVFRRARLMSGLEYTWTAGRARPGSRRLAVVNGWVDRLESSRRLRRHQLHAVLEYGFAGATVLTHYEWVVSHDDGDGPFSFPARQDDLASEWARSAGMAPHQLSIVGQVPPVAGVSMGAILTVRSRAPLDIRSGTDAEGNRLYTDRGDHERNAGEGPGFQSIDLFAHRRVQLPYVRARGTPIFVDVTVSADSLIGAANHETVGAVLPSPYFGDPVAAHPGRTLRVGVRLSR